MPLSQSEIERRLSQQGADIEGIYEIVTQLKTVQDHHTTRFDRVDARLEAHDARFDAMEARLDGRFGQIDVALTEILRRLPA